MSLIPETVWEGLAEGILAAIAGATGYFFKSWRDDRQKILGERQTILASLRRLGKLLETSRGIAVLQREKADELIALLKKSQGVTFANDDTLDSKLAEKFPVMAPEEKELHGLIRAYSGSALRPINDEILRWLEEDAYFSTGRVSVANSASLIDLLAMLHVHLVLWRAKCLYWLDSSEAHALVYLADEKKHGLGFPKGLDLRIHETITELSTRWGCI